MTFVMPVEVNNIHGGEDDWRSLPPKKTPSLPPLLQEGTSPASTELFVVAKAAADNNDTAQSGRVSLAFPSTSALRMFSYPFSLLFLIFL